MQVTIFLIIIQYFIVVNECKMDSFIVGGEEAEAGEFAYSAHLGIQCSDKKGYQSLWLCGSSIINQNVLLTAGHCLYNCTEKSSIAISVGNTFEIENGVARAHSFLIHEEYKLEGFANDLALVRTSTPLEFNQYVTRVALLKDPPYQKEAKVAGWGMIDEKKNEYPDSLMYTKQYVLDAKQCLELLDFATKGTICAARSNPDTEMAEGDSGSALVVDDYIQVGIVSCKRTDKNSNVAVYTDVGFHYDWINAAAENIMCFDYEEEEES